MITLEKGKRYLLKLDTISGKNLIEVSVLETSNTAFKVRFMNGNIEWIEKKELEIPHMGSAKYVIVEDLGSFRKGSRVPTKA